MQLLKVEGCLQDRGQHESDYDSQGSDSEHSDQDSENKVQSILLLHPNLTFDKLSSVIEDNYLLHIWIFQ